MTDNNIVSMPTPMNVLADRIRTAFERTEHGRREWIEGTLELAAALADARSRFPANQPFSHWIVDAGLEDINHQDRSALISMADDLVTARLVLSETKRSSWRHIWEQEMKERFTQVGKTTPNQELIPETTAGVPPEAETVEVPDHDDAVALFHGDTPNDVPAKPKPMRPRKDSFLARTYRGADIWRAYTATQTRTMIGAVLAEKTKAAKEIRGLLLQAIDVGFVTTTALGFEKISLRTLFPGAPRGYCTRFNLADKADRETVISRIMPAAIANRDKVIASPDQLESIVNQHWSGVQQTARAVEHEAKAKVALAVMPASEAETIMFGARLWPRVDDRFGEYDYDQLRAAIWYFRDIDNWLIGSRVGNSPASRAIVIRLSVRWFHEYTIRAFKGGKYDHEQAERGAYDAASRVRRIYRLIHAIAGLLEENPDGACVMPVSPKIEGQW